MPDFTIPHSTRRDFLLTAAAVGSLTKTSQAQAVTTATTQRRLRSVAVNAPPMPELAASGVVHDGVSLGDFGIQSATGLPDVRSFRKKLGLLIPATNTSMEHELWSMIGQHQQGRGLDGIGLHTSNIVTPRPRLRDANDLLEYQRQFIGGLGAAVQQALLAQPEYLIMGMSLEHILKGIEPIRALMTEVEEQSGLSWATWHEAIPLALSKYQARRIGLLTPFDATGNDNAKQMFRDLGFEVVTSFGFACANALHIAHLPDEAKEKAILELIATPANRLDAVVQCGTNMSMTQVSEKLEPQLGIPILGINATLFWHALRENGIHASLQGFGRLLREH